MYRRVTEPRWGVSGDAILSSTIRFDRTICPFDQTMRPLQPTKSLRSRDFSIELGVGRPFQQSNLQPMDFSKELWFGRAPQIPQPTQAQRQLRECPRPPPKVEEHLMAPRRSLHLSQLASRPLEIQTRPSPRVIIPSLEVLGQTCGRNATGTSQPQVILPSARHREIMSDMSQSVEEVMSSMLPGGLNNMQWKFKLQKKNIAYYRDEASIKAGQTRFCCVSHTHATVDELVSLFFPTDNNAVLRNNKLLHDNVMDAKVLLTLRCPTKERPMNSMYVRYTSFRTSGPLPNREMYVVVATDMIRQSDGSTVGYCLWESIDDHEILNAVKTTGHEVSTSFCSGFLFHHPGRTKSASGDSMEGYTKIIYMVGMEGGYRPSSLTSRSVMEKHGLTVDRLCSHFRQNHLDPSTFVVRTQWKTLRAAKSCNQCKKPFHMLSKRVNCHACGHVVCKSCISKETVALPTIGVVSTHVCFGCLKKAGLPTPTLSIQKTRSSLRQKRLHYETASTFRDVIAVVYTDISEAEDDTVTDTDEWAITTMGLPIRPSRIAAFVKRRWTVIKYLFLTQSNVLFPSNLSSILIDSWYQGSSHENQVQ
ncbi:unnamed protein product [Peronospora belbahrii]|uniref:FYVE-type domain-containing protein n=1 Tax=Peronospora belbahrii TaxID=622444 RepID=A0AAU9KYR9_9STRA|nr:unnamed protein product [Peronospora belbahrii]